MLSVVTRCQSCELKTTWYELERFYCSRVLYDSMKNDLHVHVGRSERFEASDNYKSWFGKTSF